MFAQQYPQHYIRLLSRYPHFISSRGLSFCFLILALLFVRFLLLAHGKKSRKLGASLLLPGFGPDCVVSESRKAHLKSMQSLNKILLRFAFLIPQTIMARSWLDNARKPSVDDHYSFRERKPRFSRSGPAKCRHLLFIAGAVAFFIAFFTLHVSVSKPLESFKSDLVVIRATKRPQKQPHILHSTSHIQSSRQSQKHRSSRNTLGKSDTFFLLLIKAIPILASLSFQQL